MNILKELLLLKESTDNSALLREIGQSCALQCEFYRGARPQGDVFKRAVRQDRRPLDAAFITTALFNLAIEQKFKISDVRARSTFATADMALALNYGGHVYSVFPPNNASILFNPSVYDSGDVLDDIAVSLQEHVPLRSQVYHNLQGMPFTKSQNIIDKFTETMTEGEYDDFVTWSSYTLPKFADGYELITASDIHDQIQRRTEIMIISDVIYGVYLPYAEEEQADKQASGYDAVIETIKQSTGTL